MQQSIRIKQSQGAYPPRGQYLDDLGLRVRLPRLPSFRLHSLFCYCSFLQLLERGQDGDINTHLHSDSKL